MKIGSIIIAVLVISFILFAVYIRRPVENKPAANISHKVKLTPIHSLTPQSTKEKTIVFGGDMMFDRMVSYKFPEDKLLDTVENISSIFKEDDLAVVNLEGPIAKSYSAPNIQPNNMTFHFPPETANVLSVMGIDAASLANNHSLNGGKSELENTKNVLLEKNIKTIGSQTEAGIENFELDDFRVSIIAINTLETDTDLTEMIQKEKQSGAFVIVFPHWGAEYQKIHSNVQGRLAHAWIDSGADLIIGSHPHVVQDAENYNGKPIFYSLGNLLFDQTFSKETQRGLILKITILNQKLNIELTPTIQKNLKPELMQDPEKSEVINKFKEDFNISSQKSNIFQFDIK